MSHNTGPSASRLQRVMHGHLLQVHLSQVHGRLAASSAEATEWPPTPDIPGKGHGLPGTALRHHRHSRLHDLAPKWRPRWQSQTPGTVLPVDAFHPNREHETTKALWPVALHSCWRERNPRPNDTRTRLRIPRPCSMSKATEPHTKLLVFYDRKNSETSTCNVLLLCIVAG